MVAIFVSGCYNGAMEPGRRWVLLAYHLPRTPSTPRIALWRKLRQLGAVQVIDGLAVLPLSAHTREQFDWLAEIVLEADGEASVWIADASLLAHGYALVAQFQAERAKEYQALAAAADCARREAGGSQGRTLSRLRREMRRIRARDYFAAPERRAAEAAVAALATMHEAKP
jgi:hypothetical protein